MKLFSTSVIFSCFYVGSLCAMHRSTINYNYNNYNVSYNYNFPASHHDPLNQDFTVEGFYKYIVKKHQEEQKGMAPGSVMGSSTAMTRLRDVIDRKCKEKEQEIEQTKKQMSINFVVEPMEASSEINEGESEYAQELMDIISTEQADEETDTDEEIEASNDSNSSRGKMSLAFLANSADFIDDMNRRFIEQEKTAAEAQTMSSSDAMNHLLGIITTKYQQQESNNRLKERMSFDFLNNQSQNNSSKEKMSFSFLLN